MPEIALLKEHIIAYNRWRHEKSLSDGTYRGEEGILRLRPEHARSLGLRVRRNPDYAEARALFAEAETLLKKIVRELKSRSPEAIPGAHAEAAGRLALEYNRILRLALDRISVYRAGLKPASDERFDRGRCEDLMERLLREGFRETSYNLRDSLAYFYNRCQGLDNSPWPLGPENVGFVNRIFSGFTEGGAGKKSGRFDLDRWNGYGPPDPPGGWDSFFGRGPASRVAVLLQKIREGKKPGPYPVSPVLFMALIRQESNFDPGNVSQVGAAGLTQIMPRTAKGLGMKRIFMPAYLREAGRLMGEERRCRRKALSLVKRVTPENRSDFSTRARRLMQRFLELSARRVRLYARYRRELASGAVDDRLDPEKALRFGFRYFSDLMRQQKGDISLALSSYNAGPHRVRQYGGIPPFSETVDFRNRVLMYYRAYMKRIRGREGRNSACKERARAVLERRYNPERETHRDGKSSGMKIKPRRRPVTWKTAS